MLALSTIRARWAGFVGSFVALTLGVGVLSATLVVFVSARPAVPPRLAGAAVIVQSPAAAPDYDTFVEYVPWSSEVALSLAHALSGVPGVASAVPDRSFYAQVVSSGHPDADSTSGHGWSTTALAPYRLAAGRAPRAPDEVALSTRYGLAPGAEATVLTATGPRQWTVVATVDGPGLYVSDASAAALAPGVSAIGLVLAPGASASTVASAARDVVGPGGTVVTGAAREALEPEAVGRTRWLGTQLLTVMAVLAAFATIFVMASTSALNAYQRRRELALLRALGATPRQVRRLLLGEALVVGTVAAVLGAVAGATAAPAFGDLLVRASLEPAGFEPRPSPLALVPAVVTGIVVAVLGAWAASRRAGRVRPIEALREAVVDRRAMTALRWVFGGLFGVTGVGLALSTPAVSPSSSMTPAIFSALTLIVALTLLAPVVLPPVVRLLTVPLRSSATGTVVRGSAVTAVRRTAATAGPVLLTVGFAVLILGMVRTMSPALGASDARALDVSTVVTPSSTPGLSDAAVDALPATVLAGLSTSVFAVSGGRAPAPLDALGVDPAAVPAMGAGWKVSAGSLADLTPSSVVVAAGAAAAAHWRAGGTASLILADGEVVTLRVAAVVAEGSLPVRVVLPRPVVRTHDPSALTATAYVRGATPAEVSPALAGLGAEAQDPLAFAAADDEDRLVWLFVLVMIGMSVGYTSIAVANTLVMATGDRRRDFRALALSGATRRQILRMVGVETAVVVAIGTAIGALVALPALLGVRAALASQTEAAVSLVIPWPELAGVVGLCAVLALSAALLTTGRMLHRS